MYIHTTYKMSKTKKSQTITSMRIDRQTIGLLKNVQLRLWEKGIKKTYCEIIREAVIKMKVD